MIIAVINNKGGVGKTTSVVHLAHALAQMNKRVLVVDLDSQANVLAHLFDEETVSETRLRQNGVALPTLRRESVGVDVLPLSFWSARPQDYAQAVQNAAANYDVVLIDCPPSLEGRTEAALTVADYALVPTEPEKLSIDGIDNLLAVAPRFNVQILGVIVTRYNKKKTAHAVWLQALIKHYGRDLIRHYVTDSSVFPSASTNSQTAFEWTGRRKNAALEAYRAIAETMLKRAGKEILTDA